MSPCDSLQSFPKTSSEAKEQLKAGWRKYAAELLGTLVFVYLCASKQGLIASYNAFVSVTLAQTNQFLQVSETKGFIGAGLSLFAAIFVFGRQRCSWNDETITNTTLFQRRTLQSRCITRRIHCWPSERFRCDPLRSYANRWSVPWRAFGRSAA